MMYILFTISKESRKNFYPRQDLNPGPRPQSKSDDLDRSAIGPNGSLNLFPKYGAGAQISLLGIDDQWVVNIFLTFWKLQIV